MITRLTALSLLCLTLSGCACALDSGDSMSPDEYVSGCWAAAKRETQ